MNLANGSWIKWFTIPVLPNEIINVFLHSLVMCVCVCVSVRWPCRPRLVPEPSPGFLTGWRSSSVSLSTAPPHFPGSPDGCSSATAVTSHTCLHARTHTNKHRVFSCVNLLLSQSGTYPVHVRVLSLLKTSKMFALVKFTLCRNFCLLEETRGANKNQQHRRWWGLWCWQEEFVTKLSCTLIPM